MQRFVFSLIVTAAVTTPLLASSPDSTHVKIATEYGTIRVALFPDRAPLTVANFLAYVRAGHYEGGSFYRTVRDDNQPDNPVKIDVIQAGVHPWMENFARDPIALERTSDTGVHHLNGTISMARSGPDTATSSFFICVGDQPELDFGGHRNPDGQGFAAFGQVVEGMDVVRRIHESGAKGQALVPPIQILEMSLEE